MRRCKIPLLIIISFLTMAGCAKEQPPVEPLSPSEAHQKLVQILKEENNLTVVTKEFKNTLWIYLPLEKSFFKIKAKKKQPSASGPAIAPTIHFLEGEFKNQSFTIQYDIGTTKQYAKDLGYASTYSEEYQLKQKNLLAAIFRAYSGFKESPKVTGDEALTRSYIQTEEAPNFFVIIIADIANGLEMRTLLYLQDLKRAYTDQTFSEEYAKRIISTLPLGNIDIIDDKEGNYVNFRDITWPEFLTKQMIHRINFRYQPNTRAPSEDARDEILKIAAETVAAYNFTDFRSIYLNDLNAKTTEAIDKKSLQEFLPQKAPPSKGRLIHIRFE